MRERKQHKREDNGEGGGSVWTSFSDLFTSLSIIFLVMFIVAVIKLSLNSIDSKAFKEANLTAEQKQKTEDKKLRIKESMQMIDDKMDELETLTVNLKKHRKVMDDLIVEQVEKDQMIENSRRNIEKNREQIADLKRERKELDQKVEKQEKDISELNINVEKLTEKKQELIEELQAEVSEKKLAKQEVANKLNEIKNLEENLERTKEYHRQELENKKARIAEIENESKELNQKISDLEKTRNDLEQKVENQLEQNRTVANELSTQKIRYETLENAKKDIESELTQMKSDNENLEQKLTDANIENAGLKGRLSVSQDNVKELEGKVGGYETKISDLEGSVSELKGQNNSLTSSNKQLGKELKGTSKKLANCEEDVASVHELAETNRQLRRDMAKQGELLKTLSGREPASEEQCTSMKCMLAKNISERLSRINPKYATDTYGKLTLQMDDSFGFKNDSAELRPNVKGNLKNVIKVYSEELFKDPEIRDQIENIYIIGHASPRHRGAYVAPNAPNLRAFKHNLDLSVRRSVSIVNFVIGPEMGDFKDKGIFQTKVYASGKGYADPVPLAYGSEPNGCGPYDCKLSRRVEIYFTLKEGKDGEDIKKRVPASVPFVPQYKDLRFLKEIN